VNSVAHQPANAMASSLAAVKWEPLAQLSVVQRSVQAVTARVLVEQPVMAGDLLRAVLGSPVRAMRPALAAAANAIHSQAGSRKAGMYPAALRAVGSVRLFRPFAVQQTKWLPDAL